MHKFYLDDAGSQDNSSKPIFAVGGYVAPVEIWDSFNSAWQKVLDDLARGIVVSCNGLRAGL